MVPFSLFRRIGTSLGPGNLLVDSLGLDAFEESHWNVVDESVEFLLGILRVIASSRETNAESVWNAFNAAGPEGLVERGIETDVRGAHVFLGKGPDDLDSLGSPLFKGA